MSDDVITIIVVQLMTFLTLFLKSWFDERKVVRRREWDLEDRELARKELQRRQDEHYEASQRAILENTEVTIQAAVVAKEAFVAANATNEKIADLNARLLEHKQESSK
jgi:hypothetical protein